MKKGEQERALRSVAMPFEYDRFPEYRRLEKLLVDLLPTHGVFVTAYVYQRLYVELGYQCIHHPIGQIPKTELEFFHHRLQVGLAFDVFVDVLLKSKVLKDDGPEYYMCSVFFLANEFHLRPIMEATVLRNWEKEKYERIRKACAKRSIADATKMPPEYFSEVDGDPVQPVEMNSAIAAIRVMDAILKTSQRDPIDFSVGLIQDAVRFVRRFNAEKVDVILRRFFIRRRQPGVPRQPEQILADIDSFLLRIEPDEGWIRFSKHKNPHLPPSQRN